MLPGNPVFPSELFLSCFPEKQFLTCYFLLSTPGTCAPPVSLCRSPLLLLHRKEMNIRENSRNFLLTTYRRINFHPVSGSPLSFFHLPLSSHSYSVSRRVYFLSDLAHFFSSPIFSSFLCHFLVSVSMHDLYMYLYLVPTDLTDLKIT